MFGSDRNALQPAQSRSQPYRTGSCASHRVSLAWFSRGCRPNRAVYPPLGAAVFDSGRKSAPNRPKTGQTPAKKRPITGRKPTKTGQQTNIFNSGRMYQSWGRIYRTGAADPSNHCFVGPSRPSGPRYAPTFLNGLGMQPGSLGPARSNETNFCTLFRSTFKWFWQRGAFLIRLSTRLSYRCLRNKSRLGASMTPNRVNSYDLLTSMPPNPIHL